MLSVYLDWAATAPPDADAWRAGSEAALGAWANPSSGHRFGKEAKALLEDARASMARDLGTKGERLVFCSGGTEANHIVMSSALSRRNCRLITSAVEHPGVHETATALSRMGLPVKTIPCDSLGMVDPERVVRSLESGPAILCLIAVNNETGAVQDLAGIVRALRSVQGGDRVHIHADAVQAFGKIPFSPEALGLDSCSFSAHKLGGPRGWGFLWTARRLEPLLRGGGQEGGQRPGTENLAGALSSSLVMHKALSKLEENLAHGRVLEAALIAALEAIPGARIIPEGRRPGDEGFSPWIVQAALPSLPAEVLVRIMDDQGIALSTGSACSTGRSDRRILQAMGVDPELAARAFRISTGPSSSLADIDAFGQALTCVGKEAPHA